MLTHYSGNCPGHGLHDSLFEKDWPRKPSHNMQHAWENQIKSKNSSITGNRNTLVRNLPLSLQPLPLQRFYPYDWTTESQGDSADLVRCNLVYCSHFKMRKLGPERLSDFSHITQVVACRIRAQTETFCFSSTVILVWHLQGFRQLRC